MLFSLKRYKLVHIDRIEYNIVQLTIDNFNGWIISRDLCRSQSIIFKLETKHHKD